MILKNKLCPISDSLSGSASVYNTKLIQIYTTISGTLQEISLMSDNDVNTCLLSEQVPQYKGFYLTLPSSRYITNVTMTAAYSKFSGLPF